MFIPLTFHEIMFIFMDYQLTITYPISSPIPFEFDIKGNQTRFVKGRSISENIMLAQEIIHQIKKPVIGGNVILKLDMAKAYDRVSWFYICIVMRKMGFAERVIDMV